MSEKLLPEQFDFNGPFPRLKRRLRLGVVGGGRISRTQAMAARLSDYWEVTAGVFSSDSNKSKEQAASWFVQPERTYDNFESFAEREAQRSDGIDAVMVTTPNHLHFDASQTFIKAGIAVLCDKPLTNEIAQALTLVKRSNELEVPFAVGYVMSCYPMVRQARDLISTNAIGDINQVHVEFMQDWMVPEGALDAAHVQWRIDPKKSGKSSCTADIGTHAAHLASFVTGMPITRLRADMHVCGAPQALEDTVFMTTEFAHSVPGTLIATRLASGNRGGLRLRVYGSEGGLEWNMEQAEQLKLCRYGSPDQIITRGHGHGVTTSVERLVRTGRGFSEGIIEAWANLYTEFALKVAAHKDGIEVPDNWLMCPDVAEGATGVQFVEAAVQSHEKGGEWVSVEAVDSQGS